MHTTTQARELWCPMVRTARHEEVRMPLMGDYTKVTETIVAGCNTDALGGNRVPASCRCIADQCAMWRWGDPVQRRIVAAHPPEATHESDLLPNVPAPGPGFEFVAHRRFTRDLAHWHETQASADTRRLGYCGLAGAPSAITSN